MIQHAELKATNTPVGYWQCNKLDPLWLNLNCEGTGKMDFTYGSLGLVK